MGCHGNRAFSQSHNRLRDLYLRFQGVPGNSLAPIQSCPWGAFTILRSWDRWFEAKISLFMMFVYVFILFMYKAFINILECENEVISYITTR